MAMRDLNEENSAPVSAMREMFETKTFAELLGSKTEIAETRERQVVKYPKKFEIDEE